MRKNEGLDNISGQEIKELIAQGKLDINTASEETLQKLLDYETDLLFCDTADMELIRACSARLELLRGDGLKTDKTTDVIINEAVNTNISDTGIKKRLPKRKLLTVAIIAATLASLTLVSTASITARQKGLAYVSNNPVGTTIEMNESETGDYAYTITHIKPDTSYDSLESLLADIGRDLFYPAKLPGGAELKRLVVDKVDGYYNIEMSTNGASACVSVTLDYCFTEDMVNKSFYETYTAHGIEFYVNPCGDFAFCIDNGDYYCITAKSRDDLIFIIDNLKKG